MQHGGRFKVVAPRADMTCYSIRLLNINIGTLSSGCTRGSSATTHLHQPDHMWEFSATTEPFYSFVSMPESVGAKL